MIRKAPMLRRIPRLLRVSLIAAVVLAVSASVYQTWVSGGAGLGATQTAFGPLTQNDINLLTAVRQANIWEGPTSEQAQQMATSPAVRDVAGKLAAEHAELDVEIAANHASIAYYANNNGEEFTAPIVASFAKNIRWQGLLLYTVGDPALHAAAEDITAALADGALPVGEAAGLPLRWFPLEETAAAHDAVEQGETGKVLIRVADAE
jgi:NADPH2:quinone reductase